MIMMRMIKVIQPLVDKTLNPLIRQAPVLGAAITLRKQPTESITQLVQARL